MCAQGVRKGVVESYVIKNDKYQERWRRRSPCAGMLKDQVAHTRHHRHRQTIYRPPRLRASHIAPTRQPTPTTTPAHDRLRLRIWKMPRRCGRSGQFSARQGIYVRGGRYAALTVPKPGSNLGDGSESCPPAPPPPSPSLSPLSPTEMSLSSTGEDRKDSCLEWLVLWPPWALPCKLPLSDFFRTIDTSPMLPCL